MTTFEQEFGGATRRFGFDMESAPSCFDVHLGPFGDWGMGIETTGDKTPLHRCMTCDRLLVAPNNGDTLSRCGFGPVHYNRMQDNEADYSDRLVERLVSCGWQVLRSELTGKHKISGQALRVDHVVEPPDSWTWFDRSAIFALECKRHGGAWKDKAAAMWQAIDYTHTDWPGFGTLPVLLSPAPWEDSTFVQHVMGKGRIGEATIESSKWQWAANGAPERIRTALTVKMSGHVLWTEDKGLTSDGKRWSLRMNRFGSAR